MQRCARGPDRYMQGAGAVALEVQERACIPWRIDRHAQGWLAEWRASRTWAGRPGLIGCIVTRIGTLRTLLFVIPVTAGRASRSGGGEARCQGPDYLATDLDPVKLALAGIPGGDCGGRAASGAESSEANNSRKSSTNEIRTTIAEPARPRKNRAMITSMKTTPKACIPAVWCLNCQQKLRAT